MNLRSQPFPQFCRPATLVIAFLCLGAGPVFSGWSTFTAGDGLASNTVNKVLVDSDGSIWFGTGQGVSRFDGVTWVTLTTVDGLAQNSVEDIEKDSEGVFWFGTGGGVSRFDGVTWTTFSTADGLADNRVTVIEQDSSGSLWFGTRSGGVSRFDGEIWTTFTTSDGLANNWVLDIEEDSSGVLWFATFKGVSRFDGVSWTTFTTAEGLADDSVYDIEEDSSGALWFGTIVGVSRLDGMTWTTFTTAEGLADNRVFDIEEDLSGALWFAGAGVSRFDGVSWTIFTANGNPVFAVDIEEDSSGAFWFAGSGVSRFDGVTWTTFSINDGLADNAVNALYRDSSGVLWLGTGGGVSRFDGATWTTFTTSDGLVDNRVQAIEEDSMGALWFGTRGGVSRFDGVTWTNFTANDGLGGDEVTAIERLASGTLWFATQTLGAGGFEAGLSSFDGVTWAEIQPWSPFDEAQIDDIHEDASGSIWVASFANGVFRFDSNGWSSASVHAFAIEEDASGSLWFGGLSQVVRFDGAARTVFTPSEGLADSRVWAIHADSNETLWFGTQGGGVSRFDGETWTTFTVTDGLASNLVSAIQEDYSGALWFGTPGSGTTQHRPDRVAPHTVVTLAPPLLSSNPAPNVVFGAAFRDVEGILFSHALNGAPWSAWSASNSWIGLAVSDGVHTFAVRSRDSVGNTDPTPAAVLFEIDSTPPAPVIASPVFGQAVSGSIEIVGTATDSRFHEYRVESRQAGTESWTEMERSSFATVSDVLGVWDTNDLADGDYEIRVSMSDLLGLTGVVSVRVEVDNEFPHADQTSPARISATAGGDVYTTNQEMHLYFPPGAFADDAVVVIDSEDVTFVPDELPSGARRVLSGADLSWGEAAIKKSAVLSLSLEAVSKDVSLKNLAVYTLVDNAAWVSRGGTVDPDKGRLSTSIISAGRYAVFEETETVSNSGTLTQLIFTPRVFSPSGGFSNPTVAISFSMASPATATIRVHSRSGRLVRELALSRHFNAGNNVVHWNGRNTSGHVVDDGLYLVSVKALGETRTRTLAVVR